MRILLAFMRPMEMVLLGCLLVALGCSQSESRRQATSTDGAEEKESTASTAEHVGLDATHANESGDPEDHGHEPGAHGGIIVSLGRDNYHVEAIVTDTGELQLYTLGNDETRVMEIPIQDLVAYVKAEGDSDSATVKLQPRRQQGDKEGSSSLFVAQLPEAFLNQAVDVTVPNISIEGERFRLGFTTHVEDHAEAMMPTKVADEEERQLYLTPGGIYTEADISANGNMTATEKFVAFHAKHDLHPRPGDRICPVTLTKANPECSWVIGGKAYWFCCPPCIDEYVLLAKTNPEEIKDPEYWVKNESGESE